MGKLHEAAIFEILDHMVMTYLESESEILWKSQGEIKLGWVKGTDYKKTADLISCWELGNNLDTTVMSMS